MDSARREEWYFSWMTGPAWLQIENRKKEAAELYSALATASDVSYDAQTLQDLLHILNHEFLCHKLNLVQESSPETYLFHADDFPIALPREWATGLLGILSNCLVKSVSPTAYRERELQCRALLATIALLLVQKVEALQNDFHNGFHQSLSRRFEDLQWQAGPTGDFTNAKFCKVQCSYLLAAAEEYSSRFRRAEPLLLTVSSRILSLLSYDFSVASPAFGSGGFNLQAALTQLTDSLSEICRRPGKQYEAMFNLQELCILVNALEIYQGVVKKLPGKAELADAALSCAKKFGSAILQTVMTVVLDNDSYESRITPPAEFWQKYGLAPLHRGPPDFNTFYYMYGIVDCASQVTCVFEDSAVAQQLNSRFRAVVVAGSEAIHRWKALEYLLSVESNYSALERDLLKHVGPEAKSRLQHELECILAAVRGEVAKYPLPTPSSGSSEKKRRIMISPASCMEKSGFSYANPKVDARCEQFSIRSSEFPVKNVLSTGFSPDCSAAFSQTSDRAIVISLSNMEARDEQQPVLARQQTKGIELTQAALSNKYLATISNKELRVTAYRHSMTDNGELVGVEPLGKTSEGSGWVPYGLTIHDARRRTWVAVAGETTSNGLTCGIVEVYEIYGSGTMGVLRRHNNAFTQASRDVLKGSSIQSVEFSTNGARLVCLTNDNRVLIWLLTNNLRPRNEPFVIQQKFTDGPDVAGLTSATVFQGPSTKNYVLGTTWPSIERHRNGGEWSFVSPIASSAAEVPKRVFHKLKDLGDAGPIIAGAAAPRGEVVALWEDNGQIVILPLEGNEEGGLRSRELIKLDQKKKSLWRMNRTSPSSMRFRNEEDGLEFFALGRNGTILYKHFEGFDRKVTLHSPRASLVAGLANGEDLANARTPRGSQSNGSRSEDASDIRDDRSRLDSEFSGHGDDSRSELALLNQTLRKTAALSFSEEASVTTALVLTRPLCPKNSLWRRTLIRNARNSGGEQTIHDYFAAFQTYLTAAEDVEEAMVEHTLCEHVFHNEEGAGPVWTSRPPRTPSMDSHSNSAREIYDWLWYLQHVHSRTMAGVQLLHDQKLLEGFLNTITINNARSKVARLLPISLELLEVMTESILKGLDILRPHLDDPREMGLMEMFDALFPLKRVLDSVARAYGFFGYVAVDGEEEDADTGLPEAEELERFRLLSEMVLLSVISYPGSHATDFPKRHLRAECKEFRMTTNEWTVSFKQQPIGCLMGLVKRPCWVFCFDKTSSQDENVVDRDHGNENEDENDENDDADLHLSTSIPDFADLWGGVSLIYPVKSQPHVTEIDWPGGTLRAAPNDKGSESDGRRPAILDDEVLCHALPWSSERREHAVAAVPFDSRKRLVIYRAEA